MMPTSKTGPTKYLRFTDYQLPVTSPGFTLIELGVVFAIIAILSLIIIPSFRGLYSEIISRGEIRKLVSTINYARSEAISSKRIHRFYLDKTRYWLSKQEDPLESTDTYVLVPTPIGREIILSEGWVFKQQTPSCITFHPSGRVEGAPLYLEDQAGQTYKITINPLGRIRIEE